MKFLLHRDSYHILRDTLRHWGRPDKYAGKTGAYPVFSQYYDTQDLRFFYDKMDGEWEHIKVRVRQYSQEFGKAGLAFLEAKIKHNFWQSKIRIPVDDVKLLRRPDKWSRIDKPGMDFFVATQAMTPLSPVCNVYYEREAFSIQDGVDTIRFNFDTNIAYLYADEKKVTRETLERRRMLKEVGCVLEVKTQKERLPDFLQAELRHVGARLTTFSKYTTAILRLDERDNLSEVHV
jgi:hypothetical protein